MSDYRMADYFALAVAAIVAAKRAPKGSARISCNPLVAGDPIRVVNVLAIAQTRAWFVHPAIASVSPFIEVYRLTHKGSGLKVAEFETDAEAIEVLDRIGKADPGGLLPARVAAGEVVEQIRILKLLGAHARVAVTPQLKTAEAPRG